MKTTLVQIRRGKEHLSIQDGVLRDTYVFTHDHLGVQLSELFSHDADLLAGDVVDLYEEAFAVVTAGLLESIPSPLFLFSFGFFWHFCSIKFEGQSYLLLNALTQVLT